MRAFVKTTGKDGLDYLLKKIRSSDRKTLIIGGCGFDPRTILFQQYLSRLGLDRIESRYINEIRPRPNANLLNMSQANRERVCRLNPKLTVSDIVVVGDDGYVSIFRDLKNFITGINREQFAHVVIDASALSAGIFFPLVKSFRDFSIRHDFDLHLIAFDIPPIDRGIITEGVDAATEIRQFEIQAVDKKLECPKLWIPHLTATTRIDDLEVIGKYVDPKEVYPIITLPTDNPRHADDVVWANRRFLTEWDVDLRDIVHASEDDPLFLYRSLSTISDLTKNLYEKPFKGRHLVVTPSNEKISAIGVLLSGLENSDVSVVYRERARYHLEKEFEAPALDDSLIQYFRHFWVEGKPYAKSR